MLNWLSKEFLLATIAALAIALIAVSWGGTPSQYIHPPLGQGSEDAQNNQETTNQTKVLQIECNPNCTAKNPDEIRKTGPFVRVINKIIDDPITSGILIFNALLVLVVLSQVMEARKSSERQLRAYIVSTPGQQFRQGATKGLKFEFRPFILNTGQTPAYQVRSVSRIRFMSVQEAATFDFTVPDTGMISEVTLGSQQNRFVHTIYDGVLSKTELRQYQRFEKNLFVYGTTRYRDAFGRPRYTNHCYSISWWRKRSGAPLWQTVARHSDSN
jgi:hypothetical protein